MDAISFVISMFVYIVVFNAIVLIPGGIVLLIIQAALIVLVGKEAAKVVVMIPFFGLCFLSLWLAYKAAQNNAFYNHGFLKSAALAMSETKSMFLASLPFKGK